MIRNANARIIVFAALTLIACGERPSRTEKYRSLYRADRAVVGAIAVGLSYADLGVLLREFSTELLIASDTATTDSDKALVKAYGEALVGYKDSLTVWKHQIDSTKYEWLEGKIPLTPELEPLVGKYGLTTDEVSQTYSGTSLKTIPSDSIQKVWEAAGEKSTKAAEMFLRP